ncbi:MAG: thioredoxin-disulfide reductase [Candidatus Rokuibacteriota bacterium]
MSDTRKVVIVGSGPAGLTAAIYTGRANLAPVMFAGSQPGGQLMLTTDVENYPGFVDAILGPDLMDVMRRQAQRFGAEVVDDDVISVDLSQRPFSIKTTERTVQAQALIVTTGASAKMLGLASERKLLGRGLSTCATCDGFFFKGQELVVVGGGDSAMEEAIFLTRFATKVTVVHRRDTLRASKIMQDRARKNAKIAWVWNSAVEEVLGVEQGKVTGVRLRHLQTGEVSEMPVGGVFVAIGHTPNTQLFAGQLELDAGGYLLTQSDSSRTSVPGVFAGGDVVDHVYRQAVTAAGTGCMAAMDAERFLEAEGH